jgi:hypothetical protein
VSDNLLPAERNTISPESILPASQIDPSDPKETEGKRSITETTTDKARNEICPDHTNENEEDRKGSHN